MKIVVVVLFALLAGCAPYTDPESGVTVLLPSAGAPALPIYGCLHGLDKPPARREAYYTHSTAKARHAAPTSAHEASRRKVAKE